MKKTLVLSTLALAAGTAFGQSADVTTSATTSSTSQAGAMSIGNGTSVTTTNLGITSTLGGNTNRNANTARATGGAGGNGGNSASNNAVTINMGSAGDPASGTGSGAQPTANAQQVPSQQPQGTYKESIQTVGNPGAVSYGVSFSQYNCANTASVGAGFLGGVFQFGGGVESSPCNARANASALYTLAQGVATSNATLSAQLYHAAILLIGNSTKETREALQAAGVSDWAPTPAPANVPAAPAPTMDESKNKQPQYPTAQIPGKPETPAAASAPLVAIPQPQAQPAVAAAPAQASQPEIPNTDGKPVNLTEEPLPIPENIEAARAAIAAAK